MNAAKQAAWLFCLLIVLAGSAWYFASTAPKLKLDEETLAYTPDTIIYGIQVQQYNAEGKLMNQLIAPRLQHIPYNNGHLLIEPQIIISNNDGQPPWELSAARARAINGGNEITFVKHVKIHQPAGEHNQESSFQTEKLIYFPKEKYATTPLPILFSQPGSTVRAKGMQAWLSDKHVTLLSKTRITYAPTH